MTGTAINILAAGLALYFYRVLFGVPLLPLTVEPLARLNIPLLSSIPVIGEILFRQNILTYMAFVVVFVLHWLCITTILMVAPESNFRSRENQNLLINFP